MIKGRCGCLFLVVLLLLHVELFGQEPVGADLSLPQQALQEIESILAQTASLSDKLVIVKVRARAARLLWTPDPKRARMMFRDLWKWIEEQEDKNFDREEARTELLKNLFPKDSNMATKLMRGMQRRNDAEEPTFRAQIAGNDPDLQRLDKLSSGIIEQNEAIAATLLERSLSVSVSPAAFVSLTRLREKNPTLADYVFAQTLEHLKARPVIIGLSGLHLLLDYVFPARQSFGGSIATPPDESLRNQYFATAYDVLKRSLEESESLLLKEKLYAQADLKMRSLFQGQIAIVLSGLAPQYGPEFVEELNVLASKLSSGIPPQIAQYARFTMSRLSGNLKESDTPAIAVSAAIARGEIAEAKSLVNKIEDESVKKTFTQMIASVEFRDYMAKSNLAEAITAARRIEDLNLRSLLYAQVAKAAYRKGEVEFSRLILSEASSAISAGDPDGVRARALLSLASEASVLSIDDSVNLLLSAVSVINSLRGDRSTPGPLARLNDPRSLIDAPELQRAFTSVGDVDFNSALFVASKIEDKSLGLMSRLAACEKALKEKNKSRLPALKGQ